MEPDFFQQMDKFVMNTLVSATQGKVAFYGGLFSTLFTSSFTLYLLVTGYQIIAGKYQKPLEDLIYNVAKMCVITLFITNAGGWLDLSIAALNGLKVGISGDNPWFYLDQLWVKSQNIAQRVYDLDTGYAPIAGGIAALLTLIGTGIAMLVTALVFISAEITILLLTITAPVFIFCLMFGFLRQMFNNWLQAIFSSILTIMISALALSASQKYLDIILRKMLSLAEESNLMTLGLMAGVAGCICAAIVGLASKAAGQIAGVSVNAAVQGMAMLGMGIGTGMSVKGAMGSTKGGIGGTKGLIHGSYEGGIGRALDEKKSLGRAAMAGYGAARATRFVVQKIQQRRPR